MNARPAMRLVRPRTKPAPRPGVWPSDLGRPVDPMANVYAARAQSVLHSLDVRDPRGLSREQAIDVLRWNGQPV